MSQKVIVGMSGGVDSSVTALVLPGASASLAAKLVVLV